MQQGSTQAGSFRATAASGPGPYYVADTPELGDGDLNYTRLAGERVAVSGAVYGLAGERLAGAKIEIWHADAAGSYHPNAAGNVRDFPPSEVALRGFVLTDGEGRYRFSSIYPGKYPGRCRHFHVRISAAGYRPVSTQLIVPAKAGDMETPENDFVARSLPRENRVEFTIKDGVLQTEIDFHLAADRA
jgi:protocatechuate 3,4-dioxygenase beta subunit